MPNLSDINNLYNFQDTSLLCEIIENKNFSKQCTKCMETILGGAIQLAL